MKTCLVCGETKPLDAFYKRKDSPDGYRNDCKACRNSRHAVYLREVWRPNNPEKAKKAFARWRETNLEYDRERCNRYDAANRDKRRQAIAQSRKANPEHHRALNKAWRAANPAKVRDIWYRWYNGTQDPSPETLAHIDVLLGDPCCYCGASAGQIDHIEPRFHGGPPDWTNLTAACGHCNQSKGKDQLLMWLARCLFARKSPT